MIRFLTAFNLALWCMVATAVPSTPPELYHEEDSNWLERSGDTIERAVDRVSEKIDLALAGRKYREIDENPSQAKIVNRLTLREGGKLQDSTDFAFNLRLPHFERRWQIRFTSYDEESDRRKRVTPYDNPDREKQYGAGLGIFRQLGKFKASFLPRLILHDPLEINYVARFERSVDFSTFHVHHRFDLFADARKGTGEFYQINLEWHFPHWGVSTNHQEEYQERENLFTTAHGLTFDYPLNDRSSVFQSSSIHCKSRPAYHLDSVTLAAGYGYAVRADRLYLAIGPSLTFPESHRFKGQVSSTLTIKLIF